MESKHISTLVRRCPPFTHFTVGPVHICDTNMGGYAHASCSECGWTFGGLIGEPIEVVYEYASHHIGAKHDRRHGERRDTRPQHVDVPVTGRPGSAD